jgi:hypothetical protein
MSPSWTLVLEADQQCIGLRPAAEHTRAQEAQARQTQQRWNKQWPITEPCQR